MLTIKLLCYRQHMEADEFPILGEVFAIELANTAYRSLDEHIDFLADRRDAATWFVAAPAARAVTCPTRPAAAWHRRMLELRDATRACLDALARGGRPDDRHLRTIEALAATAARRRSIEWGAAPHVEVSYDGDPTSRSIAGAANEVIDFLTGDAVSLVRECEAHDCSMLFVRNHHRRRWCHDGCSHRDRQARYYRRRRAEGVS